MTLIVIELCDHIYIYIYTCYKCLNILCLKNLFMHFYVNLLCTDLWPNMKRHLYLMSLLVGDMPHCRISFSSMRMCFFFRVNYVAADDLAIQGAGASPGMILTGVGVLKLCLLISLWQISLWLCKRTCWNFESHPHLTGVTASKLWNENVIQSVIQPISLLLKLRFVFRNHWHSLNGEALDKCSQSSVLLTHWLIGSWKRWQQLFKWIFQTHFVNWYLDHFLLNCPQKSATESHWW